MPTALLFDRPVATGSDPAQKTGGIVSRMTPPATPIVPNQPQEHRSKTACDLSPWRGYNGALPPEGLVLEIERTVSCGARSNRSPTRSGSTTRTKTPPGGRKAMIAIARAVALSLATAVIGSALGAATATAQTYGFATLPPGTLNHTTASAISKVMKEKAGTNILVQPTAGDNQIIPLVGRGEAEIGITNIMEAQDGYDHGLKDLRVITAVHVLRTPFFVRKDSALHTVADLKGKRVALGYSAMHNIDVATRAILATANLTANDVKAVLVPNVARGADDFISGNADMFFFAFGGPKVREADATVGGLRVLEIDEKGMPAAHKIMPWGYLSPVAPGPIFTGVEKPMKVYSFDNLLITSAKTPDALIYKLLDTMEKNKADLISVQPVLREFSPAFGYKQYGIPYHPGAMKYFKEHNLTARPIE
jgi:TRAP transporter TAXI family solute receptor